MYKATPGDKAREQAFLDLFVMSVRVSIRVD